jgi:hypothetical protein
MNDAHGNALLVGKLLALSALVLLAAGTAAWAGWLPYAAGTSRALGRVFVLVGALDLAIAFFFMVRYRR